MSIAVLLLAAVVLLGLEASGAGQGGRKQVSRVPQGVVVVVAALVVALLSPGPVSLTVAGALIAFALIEGSALLGERGALAALLAAGTLQLQASPSPAAVLAWTALWSVVTAGLSMRVTRGSAATTAPHAGAQAEAATKAVVLGMMALMVGGLGIVVAGMGSVAGAHACGFVSVALMMGIPPLQGMRVDVFQGATPAAMALSAPLALVALGPALSGLVAPLQAHAAFAFDVVIAVGLLGLPLVALAQVSLRRLLGVLAVQQGTLPLVAAHLGVDPTAAALAGALGALALAMGVASLPVLSSPPTTWEDASGWGRRHPWRCGLLIFAAAQACGLPPTFGFALRQALAQAAPPWLSAALMSGIALSSLPVVRLALFLFGKQLRHVPAEKPGMETVLGLGLVVGVAFVIGLFYARLFGT